jgi:hypothetical protein
MLMISITYENNIYINADYLLTNAPIYSEGCISSRDIIKNKNIKDNNYIYAREINNEWIITSGYFLADKIFIVKSIIESIPELNNNDKFKDDENNMIQNIIEDLKVSRNMLPCIYLFTLNTVRELRTSMNIDKIYPDDAIVAKYGFTKDLSKRTSEDINKYSKIKNVNLKLKNCSYIDPQYILDAEIDITNFMVGLKIKLDFENEDKLVIISTELIKIIERQYQIIGQNYIGHISEIIIKIKELEDNNNKQLLKHELELLNSKHELESLNSKYKLELQNSKHKLELLNSKYNLELQNSNYENILLNKDLEIMKLQMQLNNK